MRIVTASSGRWNDPMSTGEQPYPQGEHSAGTWDGMKGRSVGYGDGMRGWRNVNALCRITCTSTLGTALCSPHGLVRQFLSFAFHSDGLLLLGIRFGLVLVT